MPHKGVQRVPDPTRRRLLGVLAALPAAAVALSTLARWLPRTVGRPAVAGTTATRCGACGSPGHTMLDLTCPAAPGVTV